MKTEFLNVELEDDLLSKFGDISLAIPTPEVETDGGILDDLNMDLGGLGSIASALGGLFAAKEDRKYKKDLLKREDERIARDRVRQDKFNADMTRAYR